MSEFRRMIIGMFSMFMLSAGAAFGQIEVSSNSSVSIGGETPWSTVKLRVDGDATALNGLQVWSHGSATGSPRTGTKSYAKITNSGPAAFGVSATGESTDSSPDTFGVFGQALGGDVSFGIYGYAAGASTNYAGYFQGNVYVTGSITEVSDANIKEGITTLSNTLDQVLRLSPKRYTFRTEPELAHMVLPGGTQIGFLAQEVEQIIPEVIGTFYQPPPIDAEGNLLGESTTHKGISYTKLIPYLIGAIQEQQAQIEALQAALAEAGITVPGQN